MPTCSSWCVFDPDDTEVTFMGALDPNTPVAQGWLAPRIERWTGQIDALPALPLPRPGRPSGPGRDLRARGRDLAHSIVIPAGYRLALTIRGSDYRYGGELSEFAQRFHYADAGRAVQARRDPEDRPDDVFSGQVTIHVGGQTDSYLLVPVIA